MVKEPKYEEGSEALDNFKRGMEALFKAPKKTSDKAKKKQARKPATLPKSKESGKDKV